MLQSAISRLLALAAADPHLASENLHRLAKLAKAFATFVSISLYLGYSPIPQQVLCRFSKIQRRLDFCTVCLDDHLCHSPMDGALKSFDKGQSLYFRCTSAMAKASPC
jgi:hypothetical protein